MPGMPLAVEATGTTKWFGPTTALDRVDFAVEPGSVHGLVGMNGAGKTTLLSVLLGLVRPDEGAVRLLGRSATDSGSRRLDGVGGFVESPRFYPYLSGKGNLGVLAGLDDGDATALVEPVLDLVGLGRAADQKVKGYSLGMRQRLGLAAAIIRRPQLLILDEPTNGLDPAGIRDLGVAVRRLAADGLTVIMSSHHMTQIEQLCDAVTVLSRGRVAFAGSLPALRAVAPDPIWRMTTSDDIAARETARLVSGIDLADHPDGGLAVTAPQSRLDHFVMALGQAGTAVRRLDEAASPLERVLEQLSGEPHPAPDLTEPVVELSADSAA